MYYTLSDLINKLQNLIDEGVPDNTPVHFSYNYGDHWRTQVAPVIENIDKGKVKYSSYHQMDQVVEDDEENNDLKEVIILS